MTDIETDFAKLRRYERIIAILDGAKWWAIGAAAIIIPILILAF